MYRMLWRGVFTLYVRNSTGAVIGEAPRFLLGIIHVGGRGTNKTNKPMKLLIALLMVCTMLSCTSQKKVLDSWMGSTKQNIIMSWGPPQRTDSDGNNGEVLVYSKQVYMPNLSVNYWDYTMIYVNDLGKIYHWKTSKQSIAPTQIDVRFVNP